MPSLRTIVVALVVAALVAWRFPLVHLSRLDVREKEAAGAKFDAKKFAEEFWASQITPALGSARDASATLTAIRNDPQTACREYGRTVGLSRSCLYLVQGRGIVKSVDKDSAIVVLEGDPRAEFALSTGLVFGNTVRDVTGAIEKSALTDSRELNEVSTELNRLVESSVVAAIKSNVAVGTKLRFVGCCQVQGKLQADQPWKLTPLRVDIE